MSLQEFVQKGWQDHADDAAGVAARLPDGLALAGAPDELGALANLTLHVMGEHLGRWDEGTRLLLAVTGSPHFVADEPAGKAVYRALAILRHGAGDAAGAARYAALARTGGGLPESSDRIRLLAGVATALAGQRRTDEAAEALRAALDLAAAAPPARSDPAARALAVAANNLAADLEERPGRDAAATGLMLLAAAAARRYWEVAGTWLEVERAEYRLATTHLAAGDAQVALAHAEACLALCQANAAAPFEFVFAHEARARAHAAAGDGDAAGRARDAAAAAAAQVQPEWRAAAQSAVAKLF